MPISTPACHNQCLDLNTSGLKQAGQAGRNCVWGDIRWSPPAGQTGPAYPMAGWRRDGISMAKLGSSWPVVPLPIGSKSLLESGLPFGATPFLRMHAKSGFSYDGPPSRQRRHNDKGKHWPVVAADCPVSGIATREDWHDRWACGE